MRVVNRPQLFLIPGIIWLVYLIVTDGAGFAQNTDSALQISSEDNRLSISATDVALELVLDKIAELTGIKIKYSSSLNKQVTIHRRDISLERALKKLLRGVNHAIIYSTSQKQPARISEILIYSQMQARSHSATEDRLRTRIKTYEKQLDDLREKLSGVEADSARAKQYTKRIDVIQKRIDRVEQQLK